MIRKRRVNPEFDSNCYLIGDKTTGEALLIDPSVSPDDMTDMLEGFSPVGIIITHSHFDHMMGLAEAVEITGAPVMVGVEDAPGLRDPEANLSLFLGRPISCSGPDHLLSEGDIVDCGKWKFTVLETPGHTAGSICLVCPDAKVMLTGDTLFAESIGRTDLPGGDEGDMKRSLNRITSLGDDFRVLPGHGPEAFIWEIREINPFL